MIAILLLVWAGRGLGASWDFTELRGTNVGEPTLLGTATTTAGRLEMSAAGADLGGRSDQGYFAYRAQAGDFDVRVRVSRLDQLDVWTKAGLMVRETLDGGGRFAAVVTTPTLSGSLFTSRLVEGAVATSSGGFPANLPNAWLRLRRQGGTFAGYASHDGAHWQPLGSVAVELPNELWLGVAASSHVTNELTVAEFAELAEVGADARGAIPLPREALGPSTRRTGLAITEIMYRAADTADDGTLEFVELLNTNPFFEDISGYRLTGEIDFRFPEGTTVPGGGFIVVAKNPERLQALHHLPQVLGPFAGALGRSGTLRLKDRLDSTLLEIPYSNRPPWPVAADGTGHSLVLAKPSHGEGNPAAWSHSLARGGSPGRIDPMPAGAWENVVINEILASSAKADLDYIELYNHSADAADISGCGLSDSSREIRYRIPAGTVLPPGGFLVLRSAVLGFALEREGETVYFSTPGTNRVIAALTYGAQSPDLPWGRFPDGSPEFLPLTQPSPGAANRAPAISSVVINEIMYHPISENDNDEYVELFNRGETAVDLSGWRFVDGIDFEFPPGTRLAAGGYLVVARNAAHLRANYNQLTPGNTLGDFGGTLSNRGERLALARPDFASVPGSSVIRTNYVVVEEVTYGSGGQWGTWSDGGGSSLERIDTASSARWASNWADSEESAKPAWVSVEATGVLDNGSGVMDNLQLILLGAGECLVDDVEVRVPGVATNLITNPDFKAGLSGWTPSGDHVRSGIDSAAGADGGACLVLRAGNQGEPLANHVRTTIRNTTQLVSGKTATLRAKARWRHGLPEMILRLKGNYLEAFGRLDVPKNLGSPGAPNSRASGQAPVAISAVTHFPVLPAVAEDVVVTARVESRPGVGRVTLNYRLDPNTNTTSLTMADDGKAPDEVAGDGVFSATIPAPATAGLVAFHLVAEGASASGATGRFPSDAPVREALVRFGEATPASSFGTYRLWFTSATVKTWTSRPVLSNEELDGTFVYGNQRVVYNIGARYSGSPWHQGAYTSPLAGQTTYAFRLPGDEAVLGSTSFNKLHALGNTPGDDATLQAEQTAYWMVRQTGLPWNYQRYVLVYVNGVKRGPIMEDTQVPGPDRLDQLLPSGTEAELYKLNGWYEPQSAGGSAFGLVSWCTLENYTTTNGVKKTARYRWNWSARATDGTANNYSNVFALTDAANTPRQGPYVENLSGVADMSQWLRTFAIEHAVGNWDSFGNRNAQNMYAYKAAGDRWKLLIWDFNIVLGNSGSDGPSNDDLFQYNGSDQAMGSIYGTGAFQRLYLQHLSDIAQGPAFDANTVGRVVDARYAALRAAGVSASSPTALKNYISSRRRYLNSYLTNFQAEFALVGIASENVVTNQNWVTLTGVAPLEARSIRVNDVEYPLTWTNLLLWAANVPLASSTNHLVVQAYDAQGQPLKGASTNLTVVCTAPVESPADHLVINEILYRPQVAGAQYVEIVNTSERSAFDLTDCRLSGLDFNFPPGFLIAPREHVVVTADMSAFLLEHGTEVRVAGEFPGNLDPNGETLRLVRRRAGAATEEVIDEVTYSANAPWPAAAQEPGVALQLTDPTLDNRVPTHWGAVARQTDTTPVWKFVQVTAPATGSRLLLYHSPLQPERDPFDLAGRWDGTIDVGGEMVEFTLDFQRTATGGWSGQFTEGGTVPLTNIVITGVTNVSFIFDPRYAPGISWRGRFAPTGDRITGTFTQPGYTFPFTLVRYVDPNQPRGGAVYLDDLSLVEGSVPAVGPNLVRDGGFESPLTSTWTVSSNHLATSVDTSVKHSGQSSLHLVANRGGDGLSTAVWQEIAALTPGQTYTLSYWYLPSELGNELTVRTDDSGLLSRHSIRPQRSATPGKLNSVEATTQEETTLRLSEILSHNTRGIADRLGHRAPWLEIHNVGSNTVRLAGFYLSDTADDLTRWAFPADASLAPGEFRLVWLDGQASESNAEEWHASFAASPERGQVLLTRQIDGHVTVVDALVYAGLAADQAFGWRADAAVGSPAQPLPEPTPGAINPTAPAGLRVVINEWMASNTRTLLSPATGRYEDWFELHNASDRAADLTGYFLTDDLANPTKWPIPPGTRIEPRAFLLVWADERGSLNGGATGLHANFKLGQSGEAIGLFSPSGALVDTVAFGAQASDVSQGRWPDGGATSPVSMNHPTPGAANQWTSPTETLRFLSAAPLAAGGLQGIAIRWLAESGRHYRVEYKDRLEDNSWTPLSAASTWDNGVATLNDTSPSTTGYRFYRVVGLD